ncbi:hypothetical protein M501DRAFT_990879 [Patellaria atrata CBS 101060]|uniref:Uncharacterized protein n=1 Tax=Patellaria atrata CBS 101060 TaxID=1346257 RepID=A0A9P4VSZ8_9PEZI|nr:hypothetical protein M501DRAFT_990879 [Patellaria atrata CBS 101060]
MTKLLDHAWGLNLRKECKRKCQNNYLCAFLYASLVSSLDKGVRRLFATAEKGGKVSSPLYQEVKERLLHIVFLVDCTSQGTLQWTFSAGGGLSSPGAERWVSRLAVFSP